jgi:hypothetical protein
MVGGYASMHRIVGYDKQSRIKKGQQGEEDDRTKEGTGENGASKHTPAKADRPSENHPEREGRALK